LPWKLLGASCHITHTIWHRRPYSSSLRLARFPGNCPTDSEHPLRPAFRVPLDLVPSRHDGLRFTRFHNRVGRSVHWWVHIRVHSWPGFRLTFASAEDRDRHRALTAISALVRS
jgi:hypothetical protein